MVISTSDKKNIILDPDFLRRLARLKIETRKILGGVMKGEKRSKKYGTSVEFADYRDYHRGDDLRYLDWNIYARLERFFLKLFQEEEDLTVHVLVDTSASMQAGDPSKAIYAKKLAAALAYIGLTNLDRVSVTTFQNDIKEGTQLLRGRAHLATILDLLNKVESGEKTDFLKSMKSFTLRHRSSGLVFVVSDFLDPVNVKEGIKRLKYNNNDILLLHVLDRTELEPDLRGDWALTDSETGDVVEVSVSPRLISDYKRRMVAYLDDLRNFARKLGLGYVLTTTDVTPEDFILKKLVVTGFVK
ncbi:MAG: DUF58 domain-containing protein [bacterium]|jgi:uncharacterized protein (DUF58 family)|nr:DUF58 domain-containing protein [bacterium]